MITLVEGIIIIVSVLILGIAYTALYVTLYRDVKLAEKEYCPSKENEPSEE